MAGRPKNPNRPATVTAVRLTKRCYDKVIKAHKRSGSNEPYNDTIERALDEVEQLRKKVRGLQVEIEDRDHQIKSNGEYAAKLFSVKENLRERVENLERQRSFLTLKHSMK